MSDQIDDWIDCGPDGCPVWKVASRSPSLLYHERWIAGTDGAKEVAMLDEWIDELEGVTCPTEAARIYSEVTGLESPPAARPL